MSILGFFITFSVWKIYKLKKSRREQEQKEELENEKEKLEKAADNIPEWLNDPEAKLSDIKYGGDLKKRF